ncbi:MAG TPA: OsmC family peroxiredoxin [Actinobacteria bacterium]|nr:OsmC family peroxiredoxin [Actinomycetota bacterium]
MPNAKPHVDLDPIRALAERIAADPTLAETTWRTSVTWEGGLRSTARVRDHEPIPSDEPATLGGTDTAPNPVEQLLAALGHCLAVGYVVNAAAEDLELRDLRIDVEGALDVTTFLGLGDGHAGFRSITVDVRLDADADPEALERLHERVVATSPVGHTLLRPVPVEVTLGGRR